MNEAKIISPDEAITLMKGKGIKFEIVSESEAKQILSERNYYHKLMAYCDNFVIRQRGEKEGQYLNLDFAYLKELSIIDMYLRYLLIHMCLDIEHHIKLMLIHDVEQNPAEDGYNIVRICDPDYIARDRIKEQATGSYSRELIEQYLPDLDFPVWVFCELSTFGDLYKLYKEYMTLYRGRPLPKYTFLKGIRNMRNNCAHNSCLIFKLDNPNPRYRICDISNIIARIPTISKNSRISYLSIPSIHDFAVVLYWYSQFIRSPGLLRARKKELYHLFLVRLRENRSFFKDNDTLLGSYLFCIKLITYFMRKY